METSPTLPTTVAKTSSQAVWSLVLGILSIACIWLLGSIPAIILGILAIKNIDRSGGVLIGRGMAIAGIVTGSVGILTGIGTVAVLASIALPAFTSVRSNADQSVEMSRIKQVAIGCRIHASDNEGAFPETLTTLVAEEIIEADLLEPESAIGQTYLYRPGLSDTSPAEEPLLASPVPITGHRVIGRVSGRVERITEEEFLRDYARLFP